MTTMGKCRRMPVLRGLLALLLLLCIARPVQADGRTAFLIDRLKSDDFRVRTNAALALGATADDAAVQPLCAALGDSNDTVRIAAAAALKRLGKSSAVGCLRGRLSVESSASVKTQITQAIDTLGGGGSAPSGNAKFYVSVAMGNNTTGHDGSQILGMVTGKLSSLGGYQLAPRSETPDAARAAIARGHLTGYYLSISAELSDTGAGVRAVIRIAVFSYPGRDLRGEVSPSSTASIRRGDNSAESNLLQAVAEYAITQFSQNFQ